MKILSLTLFIAKVIALTWVGSCTLQAQNQSASAVLPASCGVNNIDFKMKRDLTTATAATPPNGKALVYVIELMPTGNLLTTHVKVGTDGVWLAQLSGQTFTSFALTPGVHHLCARYQGSVAASELGSTILHRLNVEAGKTYYFLYRGFISKDVGEVGFFDLVDEDEGNLALRSTEHMSSTAVSK